MLQKIKDNKKIYIMLLPCILFLIIFSVYPILWILRYMFYNYNSFGDKNFVGLNNFIRLFTRDDQFFKAFLNTLIYAVCKIGLTIPIAFCLAFILNLKIKGRSFFRAILFMPTIISISVMSMVFYLIFNPYNGVLNNMLLEVNIIDRAVNWFGPQYAMVTVILVAVWGGVGNYMLYFLSGLQTMPQDIYESADIDGASGFIKFWNITLPMMAPIFQMVLMIAITQAFKDYENILVMTSGGPNDATSVLYLYIYKLMFPIGDGTVSALEYGYGATVAFVTAIIVGIITYIYLTFSKKMNDVS